MTTQWLRLWHEMPTDPKWRTISRISGQPIALVTAVYVHLLVDASRNVTRGHVTVTAEDLASALDVTEGDIEAILSAMQGRVMDGNSLSGWDIRQMNSANPNAMTPAERQKRCRDKKKQEKEQASVTLRHVTSRDVTTDTDTDTDTDKSSSNVLEGESLAAAASPPTVRELLAIEGEVLPEPEPCQTDPAIVVSKLLRKLGVNSNPNQLRQSKCQRLLVASDQEIAIAVQALRDQGTLSFGPVLIAEKLTDIALASRVQVPKINQLPTNYTPSGRLQ